MLLNWIRHHDDGKRDADGDEESIKYSIYDSKDIGQYHKQIKLVNVAESNKNITASVCFCIGGISIIAPNGDDDIDDDAATAAGEQGKMRVK